MIKILLNFNIINSEEFNNYTLTQFIETPKMSTYLLAFVVSDFMADNTTDGDYHVWYPKQENKPAEYALNFAPQAMEMLSNYVNRSYQLPKADFAAIPDFEMGAMENWGLITFRSLYLLYTDWKKSIRYHQSGALLITHELAHMWFGNEVTPKWWNDLWLSEGMARFFEYFITDKIENDWQIWNQFQVTNLQSALSQDDKNDNVRAMSSQILNPNDAKFDYLVYAKSASVIRMFREYLGYDIFQNGIRNYLELKSYGNVVAEDLYNALEKEVNKTVGLEFPYDVGTLFKSWVDEIGYPVVNANINYETKKISLSQVFL